MPSSTIERASQWSAPGHTHWTQLASHLDWRFGGSREYGADSKTSSTLLRPTRTILPPMLLLKGRDFERLKFSSLGIGVDVKRMKSEVFVRSSATGTQPNKTLEPTATSVTLRAFVCSSEIEALD